MLYRTMQPEYKSAELAANLLTGSGLVKQSATISSVLQYAKQTSLQDTFSLAKWCMTSMCFDLIEAIGCFSSLSAPWLSV